MSLKWIFALLVVAYGVNSFSAELEFNKMINETQKEQLTTAADIQNQVGISNEKTLKKLTVSDTASLEGFTIRVFN